MKNVLLISPHSSARLNETRYVSPALGVYRIAGWLNADGHSTTVFDPNLHDLDECHPSLDWILDGEWDIIGFSVLEDTLLQDLQNMWLAHKICPDALLVAGGIEAQYNYQTILDKSPCAIVVLGEGEEPMLDLCENKPLHKIRGIVFKNKAKALKPGSFETANNLISWEGINYESYWDYYMKKYGKDIEDEVMQQIHTIRVFSRNRCPFNCKFCTSTNQLPDATGKSVPIASMSVNGLIKIIKRIKSSHRMVRTIYLTDDDFCLDRKNVIDFCKAIIEEGLDNISYMCFARITDINENVLYWMRKANFRRLNIGIESFSWKVLKEVGKHYKPKKIHETLDLMKQYGIEAFLTLMLITPETTLKDLLETISGIEKYINDPFYTFGLSLGVRPTKGSRFYEMYYDFETCVTTVEGSFNVNGEPHLIKEIKMIYAIDPSVKKVQGLYKLKEGYIINKYIEEQKIKHATYSNIAKVQLELMKNCIERVRQWKK